jgi:hypothetical protein
VTRYHTSSATDIGKHWLLACFTIRAVKPFLSQESLRMVYFSYFHSILTYELVFWNNSYHSNRVFKLKKRIIRIMVGIRDSESYREYFRKLKILPLQSQYIFTYYCGGVSPTLLLFVINNRKYFKINSDTHNIITRNNLDLHYQQSHMSVYQKGTHYTGIKVFNILPVPIKQLSHDTKQFKMALKSFLYLYSFYSLDDYFNYNTY